MQIERMNMKPGFLRGMRSAMLQGSRVTPDLRKGFLERPFPKQAALIGIYAKKQLSSIDALISEKHLEGLTAVKMWKQIVEDKNPREYREKIKKLFPLLENESSGIAQTFASTYTFWVDNFYSCDIYGRSDTRTYKLSKALRFDAGDVRLINEKSGMPYLGQNIKSYAEFLYMPSD